jgi:hypothetical protein
LSNAGRFGFISYSELNQIAEAAHAIGDPSIDLVKSRLGFGGKPRNLLYAIRFPPLYFNALLQGQVFRRYRRNQNFLATVRQALGHVPYTGHGNSAPPAAGATVPGDFKALPIQSYFFGRTLAMLRKHNIQAVFIAIPLAQSVTRQMTPASIEQFDAYLRGFATRYPNFHVVEPLVVAWPDRAFVDGGHMDSAFVAMFTERFNACLAAIQRQTGAVMQCDLSWKTAVANAGGAPDEPPR